MPLRLLSKIYKHPEGKKTSFILDPFELNEKQNEPFENKERESLYLIKEHLKVFKKPVVHTSHGRDSIVLVHLVWRAVQELRAEGHDIEMPECWLGDTLNVFKEEPQYWKDFNKWLNIEDKFRIFKPPKLPNGKQATMYSVAEFFKRLPDFRRSSDSGVEYAKRKTPECCDWLKKFSQNEFMKSLPEEERYDLQFIGTLAIESQIRRLGVLQRCRSYMTKYRRPYPIQSCTPLSFWKKSDIYEYFARYKIPVNPAYEVHNQQRLGCAACTAHKGWELRLARDPTEEGYGMLEKNLKLLKMWEPDRYKLAIENLKSHGLVPEMVARLENRKTLLGYI